MAGLSREVSQAGKYRRKRTRTLTGEVSQAVSLAVVTTNCEKSAEAIVGKALKWELLKG